MSEQMGTMGGKPEIQREALCGVTGFMSSIRFYYSSFLPFKSS